MPTMADSEYAWTSFDDNAKTFRHVRNTSESRIHPTQKPVALYKWLLSRYAKPGDRIIDTHLGSGSSRIACHDMGFDFVGCEIDKDYFEAEEKRYSDHVSQLDLIKPEEIQQLQFAINK
jgi:site-specific DNA-methyltransferase (adenine-specific)